MKTNRSYYARPRAVEAIQYRGENLDELRGFVPKQWWIEPKPNGPNLVPLGHGPRVWVAKRHRYEDVDHNDWVVKNGLGLEVLNAAQFHHDYEMGQSPAHVTLHTVDGPVILPPGTYDINTWVQPPVRNA
jgi:hypothetical protein